MSFASVEEHREYLAKNAVPHSLLRRLLLFAQPRWHDPGEMVKIAIVTRAHDANTLRYLWIEAGYDQGSSKALKS